jgi:hypothetical protein
MRCFPPIDLPRETEIQVISNSRKPILSKHAMVSEAVSMATAFTTTLTLLSVLHVQARMSSILPPEPPIKTLSGTGIGREIALEFARQGADVALHYSHHDAGARSAAQEIRALGRRAEVFQADFNDVAQAQSLGQQAISFLGGVDCLVNNAGITFNRPFLTVTPEQFDAVYHVNIRAQFFLTQVVAADMLKHGGGAVCNITSIHGVSGAP